MLLIEVNLVNSFDLNLILYFFSKSEYKFNKSKESILLLLANKESNLIFLALEIFDNSLLTSS